MSAGNKGPSDDGRPFYRIVERGDGLCDIWLSPGIAVPLYDNLTGRYDYNFKVLAVRGVNKEDPQWEGDLGEHIRRHYYAWIESAEEVEI